MALPTTQQLDFVNSWCAKLCVRAGATNILGYGRNDLLFIRIITSLTRRQAIGADHFYRTMNNQNQSLPAKLESLGGSFGHFLSALSQSRESFYASEIFNSLESYSPLLNDTTVINEIFCLLPHQDLALAADAYNRRYGVNLKDTLQSKLSKTKNHLLLTIKLLQNGRSEDQSIDEALAAEQARTLNGILAKVTILGNLTDEASSELIDFILTLSYSQAQAVKKQFEIQNPSQPSVDTLIIQRTGGGFQQALLLLLSVPLAVYARKITEACTSGTEAPISRIIGGHDVGFVHQIAAEYQQNFNADIRTLIRKSTSGLFQKALVSYLEFCPFPMDETEKNLKTYLLTLDVFVLTCYPLDTAIMLEAICNRSKGHLAQTNEIYKEKFNGQTLSDYLSGMTGGGERQKCKRFLRSVVASLDEGDVRYIRKSLKIGTDSSAGIDKKAILETLCAKSPIRVIRAREMYERLHDAHFVETLQACLGNDPLLSSIVSALVSHNREQVMDRTDYDGGSSEALAAEIQKCLLEPTLESVQELSMIYLTHSLSQLQHTSKVYEGLYHKNLEREITGKLPELVGVALNALTFDPAAFVARQIHACINDPDTITRLVGGSDKSLLQEVRAIYQDHFRSDLLTDLANAYPGQGEFVAYVTAWITQPGIPFPSETTPATAAPSVGL